MNRSSSSPSPPRRKSDDSLLSSGISRSTSKISEKTMIELRTRLIENEVGASSTSASSTSEDCFTLKSQTSYFCSDTESALNANTHTA